MPTTLALPPDITIGCSMAGCALQVAMDEQGHFYIAHDRPLRVSQFVRAADDSERLELRWQLPIKTSAPAFAEGGRPYALEVGADGSGFVAGSLYSDRGPSYNEPFVARIDGGGVQLWQWTRWRSMCMEIWWSPAACNAKMGEGSCCASQPETTSASVRSRGSG